MSVKKEQVEAIFSIGESILCGDGSQYRIEAIHNGCVALKSIGEKAVEVQIDYQLLSEAVKTQSVEDGLQPLGVVKCFAAEYKKRDEQKRRDDEVDALWLKAGACQIP